MKTKSEIRKKVIEWRHQLTDEQCKRKSQKVIKRLENLELFKSAAKILIYYSVKGEVDTLKLMKRFKNEKDFYLPVIKKGNQFNAVRYEGDVMMKKNHEGIPEPMSIEDSDKNEIVFDLIIVPGVAFAKDGTRLGMGKGYYDRYLADKKELTKIGLAYSEQVLDSLPKENYDIPVDFIITEDTVLNAK